MLASWKVRCPGPFFLCLPVHIHLLPAAAVFFREAASLIFTSVLPPIIPPHLLLPCLFCLNPLLFSTRHSDQAINSPRIDPLLTTRRTRESRPAERHPRSASCDPNQHNPCTLSHSRTSSDRTFSRISILVLPRHGPSLRSHDTQATLIFRSACARWKQARRKGTALGRSRRTPWLPSGGLSNRLPTSHGQGDRVW